MDNLTLSFAGFSCEWRDLPENSKAALVTLGFSTKIKNSVAGLKKAVMGEGANPWSDDDIAAEAERIGLSSFGRNEETANAIVAATQREMFESILSGIAPSRGGNRAPRLSDDEKLRQDIQIELLEKAYKAEAEKAKKENRTIAAFPKRSKKEERAAFDALLARAASHPDFAAKVEKVFAERKKQTAKSVEGLSDLFA